jgi:hypothetical protein
MFLIINIMYFSMWYCYISVCIIKIWLSHTKITWKLGLDGDWVVWEGDINWHLSYCCCTLTYLCSILGQPTKWLYVIKLQWFSADTSVSSTNITDDNVFFKLLHRTDLIWYLFKLSKFCFIFKNHIVCWCLSWVQHLIMVH